MTTVQQSLCTGILSLAMLAGCPQGASKDTQETPPASKSETKAPAPTSQPSSQPSGESSKKGLSPSDRDATDPDGVVRRGLALSDEQALSVADVFAKADTLAGKSIKITGKVDKVCGKSGCWFSLTEGEKSVRITSKGYKYFVPSSASGMTALVEGDLEVKTLDTKEAQHFADDEAEASGKPARKIEGPVREIAIASVGLELRSEASPKP